MSPDIMHLANKLIYDNQIKSGFFKDSTGPLSLHAKFDGGKYWIQKTLTFVSDVIFIDISNFNDPAQNSQKFSIDNSIHKKCSTMNLNQNYLEENTAIDLYNAMIEIGIDSKDITMITTFNKQMNYISNIINSKSQILTIDKSQGAEGKYIIVILSVQNYPNSKQNDLLQSAQRINVAITRAKEKLMIIRKSDDLEEIPITSKLLKIIRENNWIVEVNKNDIDYLINQL